MIKQNNNNVWILDDDKAIGWVLEQTLSQAGFSVRYFEHPNALIDALKKNTPDLLFSDIRMPGMDGFEVLTHITRLYPDTPVIIMTAFPGIEPAAQAFQQGAFEYLAKPFDIDDVIRMAQKATKKTVKKNRATGKTHALNFVGKSASMQQLFATIGRLSTTHINVLITGESGTGKELVAQALHHYSPRKNKPMIALNVAAIPKELIESELFGHEKGAFTGASTQKKGRFEQAHEGTLFLDEIGDMPKDTQTRLLRVIATGEFYRVGGSQPIRTDVRILAATHQNLQTMSEKGDFREDLYHRLNVINLHCPPLRERQEDIPELCQFFLARLAKEHNKTIKSLDKATEHAFIHYAWPGNIRELENLCQNLFFMAAGDGIGIHDLPEKIRANTKTRQPSVETIGDKLTDIARHYIKHLLIKNTPDIYENINRIIEHVAIHTVLDASKGHKQKAAKRLGWGRNTLTRKLKQHGIQEDEGNDDSVVI